MYAPNSHWPTFQTRHINLVDWLSNGYTKAQNISLAQFIRLKMSNEATRQITWKLLLLFKIQTAWDTCLKEKWAVDNKENVKGIMGKAQWINKKEKRPIEKWSWITNHKCILSILSSSQYSDSYQHSWTDSWLPIHHSYIIHRNPSLISLICYYFVYFLVIFILL